MGVRKYITGAILAAIAVGILTQLYHHLGKHQKEKIEQLYRRERKEWRERLAELYRMGREINHWRHDMQGKLEILYRMQKNGKYAEVESYIEKLCGELKDYPELPQPTGNEGLDAALIKAISKCRDRGIHFSYIVLGKPERIDSIVLGNLMNNLLCNGMEACQNLSGTREMELVVHSQAKGVEIYLENSIGESVLENNPKFVSHKREKEKHGFGMESIFRIVKQYEGTYESREEAEGEENRFCQYIYLKYVVQSSS